MFIFSIIIAFFMYLAMVIINILANTLPFNNMTTGEVSLKYPNLFQPSSVTFSIWGIIYLLLLIYLIYQVSLIKNVPNSKKDKYTKVNYLFAITSLLNISWIFAWHFDYIFLSVIIIILLLVTLILITRFTLTLDSFTRSTFSIYTGWVSIATIANITVFLVKAGVGSYGTLAVILTIVVLLVGLLISCLWILKNKDVDYGIVVFWAYCGILIRHMSKKELNLAYPSIYITVIISLFVLLLTNLYVIKKSK